MHQLDAALDGDLEELVGELEAHAQSEKLKQATEGDVAAAH
jgi:protein subunit release factor A